VHDLRETRRASVLMVNFRQLRVLDMHWFRLWFATNPPIDTIMI
jgi:hypothetical protein